MKKIPPLPAHGQDVKFPNLGRNLHLFIWLLIGALVLSALTAAVCEQSKRFEQRRLERKAIQDKHAVEIKP